MKHKTFFILLLVFSLFLTGCADSPERAAKEWLDALANLDGNKLLDRTCLAQRPAVQEEGLWSSVFALLPHAFGLNIQSKTDISGLSFSRTSINADETAANVRVYGEIRVAVLAFAQSEQADETWQMIKEDGAWRWCGVAQ